MNVQRYIAAGMDRPVQRSYRFANVELLADERRLLIDGHDTPLGGRAFDLLVALVERADRTVGKEELLDVVWPGLAVEGNNLQVQISTLRKILDPRAISTIPWRGYKFTLPVSGAAAPGNSAGLPVPALPGLSRGTARPQQGNLPEALPELIGRAGEVASLMQAVVAHRLVSVVGAAGIGKTRLAQAAAQALRREFEDGVWMVELASVAKPTLLPAAVAQALGLTLSERRSALEELIDALRGRTLLVVLDNCEHLLDASSAFAQALLDRVPGAHLLATSQELLRIADEHLYHATTLSLPANANLMAARFAGAVMLFVYRVQALLPGFVLGEHNCDDVVDICRRLDGLPLAIELAAARVPLLGTAGVRERLDERFRMLTGGVRATMRRHQTLREALDWSHGLLDDHDRAVFRRAGVFAGTFTMNAAQQVLVDERLDAWEVLDHLGALVDKSLVIAELAEPPRYRLLESVRAYALEKLRDAAETDATRERHAKAVLAAFEAGLAQHWARPKHELVEGLLPDMDNLRAALEWGMATTATLHIALAAASVWMWTGTGQRIEALRICERAMKRIDANTPPALEARLLSEWCVLPPTPAVPAELAAAERAVALFRQLGDRRGMYLALESLHIRARRCDDVPLCERVALEMDEVHDPTWPPASRWYLLMAQAFTLIIGSQFEKARVAFEECLQLARRANEPRHVFACLRSLWDVAAATRQFEHALLLARELVEMTRSERFKARLAPTLSGLSDALTWLDRVDEARAAAIEAVPLHAQFGTPLWMWLISFARIALKDGRISDAALSLGRAEARFGELTNGWPFGAELRSSLAQALPDGELQRLLAQGAALTDEEAARVALAC